MQIICRSGWLRPSGRISSLCRHIHRRGGSNISSASEATATDEEITLDEISDDATTVEHRTERLRAERPHWPIVGLQLRHRRYVSARCCRRHGTPVHLLLPRRQSQRVAHVHAITQVRRVEPAANARTRRTSAAQETAQQPRRPNQSNAHLNVILPYFNFILLLLSFFRIYFCPDFNLFSNEYQKFIIIIRRFCKINTINFSEQLWCICNMYTICK